MASAAAAAVPGRPGGRPHRRRWDAGKRPAREKNMDVDIKLEKYFAKADIVLQPFERSSISPHAPFIQDVKYRSWDNRARKAGRDEWET